MVKKIRLDDFLINSKLALSRDQAKKIIFSKSFKIDNFNSKTLMGHTMVPANSKIIKNTPNKYVSRGGIKLEGFIQDIGLNVTGKVCLDIGASTGGFTDFLIQNRAKKIICIDVGKNQIHPSISDNPKVESFEGINARYNFETPKIEFQLVVVDVSFISVLKILPILIKHINKNTDVILLLKPQFEAKRIQVDKGGVIKNPKIHSEILNKLLKSFIKLNFKTYNLKKSHLVGAKGNQEFFVLIKMID
jgi:23S rRNA (cytidine1920-2'-O)/16S rRNA (cytidine1409-2'-O)-methyltransferase